MNRVSNDIWIDDYQDADFAQAAAGAAARLATIATRAEAAANIATALDVGVNVTKPVVSALLGSVRFRARPSAIAPFPEGLGVRRVRTVSLHFVGKGYIDDDHYRVRVHIDCDCFNIYDVAITYDASGSDMVAQALSDLTLEFEPNPVQARNARTCNINYRISGRWNPISRMTQAIQGSMRVYADGGVRVQLYRAGEFRVAGANARGVKNISPRGVCGAILRQPITPAAIPAAPSPVNPTTSRWQSPRTRPQNSSSATIPRRQTGTLIDVYYATGATRLSSGEVNGLTRWAHGLPRVLFAQLQAGALRVVVTGHTSRSGSQRTNERISMARAQDAARVMRQILGPNAQIRPEPRAGYDILGTTSNDQRDRRATIRILL